MINLLARFMLCFLLANAYAATAAAELATTASTAAKSHPDQSGFHILDTGQEAFLYRAAMIDAAQSTIDAQYYIWNSDTSGVYLARRLLLAADRGVQVRVVLDDINLGGRDDVLALFAAHPNIDIRVYNPAPVRDGFGKWLSFLGDFDRLNRRMHNKSFIVDGAIGIIGGRNIGDEYFDEHATLNFRDRDVMAVGPIVDGFSANFEAFWESEWSRPVAELASEAASEAEYASRVAEARAQASDTAGLKLALPMGQDAGLEILAERIDKLVWAEADFIFEPPFTDPDEFPEELTAAAKALADAVRASESEVLIESAYFILDEAALANIRELNADPLRIAVLTNSLASNDVVPNHAGYARWRPEVLEHGFELFELRPDAEACTVWVAYEEFCADGDIGLHSKTAVFDRKVLYVGSFNANLRAMYLNGETVLLIRSPELAAEVAASIETGMTRANSWQVELDEDGDLQWQGQTQTLSSEPDTDWWLRTKAWMISLLPIEDYL
ncbi:phospholipase D family protein [Allohahella marinimesophila]|uniref:phospholipase D family protein n=1 Tax=Allohahella marinimesophila TaxID=1054972 RepID=UPI0031DB5A12